MFVSLVISTLNYFASVRFILVYRGVRKQPDIIMDVKVEQWARFTTSLVHYKVVKGIVMRNDQVLLDIHEIVNVNAP